MKEPKLSKSEEAEFDKRFGYLEAYQEDIERVNFTLIHKNIKSFIATLAQKREEEGYDRGKGEIIRNSKGFIETKMMDKDAVDIIHNALLDKVEEVVKGMKKEDDISRPTGIMPIPMIKTLPWALDFQNIDGYNQALIDFLSKIKSLRQ